ncbi:ribose-phosphate pyrophosphokinase 2 [Moniliophthora roreri]|nr:ribose-phosphate pyrophosphokinase 2 [Moniliophthora roreri]
MNLFFSCAPAILDGLKPSFVLLNEEVGSSKSNKEKEEEEGSSVDACLPKMSWHSHSESTTKFYASNQNVHDSRRECLATKTFPQNVAVTAFLRIHVNQERVNDQACSGITCKRQSQPISSGHGLHLQPTGKFTLGSKLGRYRDLEWILVWVPQVVMRFAFAYATSCSRYLLILGPH